MTHSEDIHDLRVELVRVSEALAALERQNPVEGASITRGRLRVGVESGLLIDNGGSLVAGSAFVRESAVGAGGTSIDTAGSLGTLSGQAVRFRGGIRTTGGADVGGTVFANAADVAGEVSAGSVDASGRVSGGSLEAGGTVINESGELSHPGDSVRVAGGLRATGGIAAASAVIDGTVQADELRTPWRGAQTSVATALSAIDAAADDAQADANTANSRAGALEGRAATQEDATENLASAIAALGAVVADLASDLATLRSRYNSHTTHPPPTAAG